MSPESTQMVNGHALLTESVPIALDGLRAGRIIKIDGQFFEVNAFAMREEAVRTTTRHGSTVMIDAAYIDLRLEVVPWFTGETPFVTIENLRSCSDIRIAGQSFGLVRSSRSVSWDFDPDVLELHLVRAWWQD